MSDAAAPRPSFYKRWISPEGYLGLHLLIGLFLAVATAVAFDYIEEKVFSTGDIRLADACSCAFGDRDRAELDLQRCQTPNVKTDWRMLL